MDEQPIPQQDTSETPVTNTPSLKKHLIPAKITILIATIALGLLLTVYISFTQRADNNSAKTPISPTPTIMVDVSPTQSTSKPVELGVTYKNDSQYENYTIDMRAENEQLTYELFIAQPVSSISDRSLCPIGVIEIETNKEIAMFPFNEVQCQFGMMGYYPTEGFLWGWLNDDEFIIQHTHGELIAYHINGSNRRVLSYDATKYVVEKGNEDGTHWLARKRSAVSTSYLVPDNDSTEIIILDANAEPKVTHNLNTGSVFDLTYDRTNDGFFIINRIDQPATNEYSLVSYKMFWIEDSTLTNTEIETIGPAQLYGGRGCERGEFSSEPGTIIYTGLDCFILPEGVGTNDTLTFILP